jgi:hypothetical protein
MDSCQAATEGRVVVVEFSPTRGASPGEKPGPETTGKYPRRGGRNSGQKLKISKLTIAPTELTTLTALLTYFEGRLFDLRLKKEKETTQ